MRIYSKVSIVFFVYLLSCSIDVSAQKRVRGGAREPYASLSAAEKLEVQKKLVVKLKRDTDFIALEKLMQKQTPKNIGVSRQPKEQRELKVESMSRTIRLMSKYPEFGQLDSETRKNVLKQARIKKQASPIVL